MSASKKPSRSLQLFVLGGILLVIIIAAGGYFFLNRKPATPLSLGKDVKITYANAVLTAYREKDESGAIAKIDQQIAQVSASPQKSDTDLYTEAKLKIYKADFLLGGQNTKDGFALLSSVYADRSYDLNSRIEALLVALARAAQGLGEGSITSSDVEEYVMYDKYLGVAATTTLPHEVPEPVRVYASLASGFRTVMNNTSAPKPYVLAESYLLRLTTQLIEYTKNPDDGYELLMADISQFKSDLGQIVKQSKTPTSQYEEFITTSLYNLGLAYEFSTREDQDTRISSIEEVRDMLLSYAAYYPDDAYRARPFTDGLGMRLACRLVDQAQFNVNSVDKAKLKTILDPLAATAASQHALGIPCEAEFNFIAKNIDTRFAPYSNQ